ncbi:MAG: GMC family oxidoreductase N-terminal domain-containing protein, partial [Myxococcota bacterium]
MFPHELRIGAGLPIPATEVESTPASPARASEVVARTSDRIEAKGTGATSGALATNSAAQIREPLRRRSSAEFDFVVVGAGAAGATTAARLVEQGYRVLVLERGEEHANVLARDVPAGHAKASEDPRLLVDDTGYFVRFFDDQKRNESNPNYDHERGGFFYPRGEGIGGSTQQHAMIFVRAPDVDFDRIAELTGDASWSGKNMQQFWNVLEQNRYQPILRGLHWLGKVTNIEALQNLGGYGFDGWQKTTRADVKILLRDKQLLSLALRTLWFCMSHFDGETPVVRQLGDKVRNLIAKFDPNHSLSRGREGFRILPKMIDENGRRFGPRERLLSVLEEHPDRLTIRTGCTVDRVELDDSMRANHVEYLDENGERQQVLAGREVVLAAGSFETPMILMRS